MQTSARQAAIEILCQWEQLQQPVDQVRDAWLVSNPLADSRDRQLLMALVYGVLRRRGYLDSVIGRFSRHPLHKMKPRTRQALRVGVFQLLFFDRIPPAIAIHETVQVLKAARQPAWLTGFVNATLRGIDRERSGLPDPSGMNESAVAAGFLNHPLWLVERWIKRYGKDIAYSICRQNSEVPDLGLLVNLARTTTVDFFRRLAEQGIAAQPGRAPAAVRQDEAAQLVVELLRPFGAGRYLDGCAGLGGKTGQLAGLLPSAARITAVEPSSNRVGLLKQNLTRLGILDRVEIVNSRLAELVESHAALFDRVLVDAPCSGIGVIRRQPDIRWLRQPADLLRYQEGQLALLAAAAFLLKKEGVLVYATCSTEPEENDEVIARFLQSNPEIRLTDCREFLPVTARDLVDDQGFLRTLPVNGELDGFFAARLQKTGKKPE